MVRLTSLLVLFLTDRGYLLAASDLGRVAQNYRGAVVVGVD